MLLLPDVQQQLRVIRLGNKQPWVGAVFRWVHSTAYVKITRHDREFQDRPPNSYSCVDLAK